MAEFNEKEPCASIEAMTRKDFERVYVNPSTKPQVIDHLNSCERCRHAVMGMAGELLPDEEREVARGRFSSTTKQWQKELAERLSKTPHGEPPKPE